MTSSLPHLLLPKLTHTLSLSHMKSSRNRRSRFSSINSTSTITYINKNDLNTPPLELQTTEIPIQSSTELITPIPIPITINTPPPPLPPPVNSPDEISSIIKIQSSYRSYLVRTMIKKISTVKKEADRLEQMIQRQETVDAIRSNEREKVRMNEALMSLLLKLDSVPGVYESVRELRKKVSRRIVGLQEILDAISDQRVSDSDELLMSWEEMFADIEGRVCEDLVGRRDEEEREIMGRYCAENLGFRCLERFLRGG